MMQFKFYDHLNISEKYQTRHKIKQVHFRELYALIKFSAPTASDALLLPREETHCPGFMGAMPSYRRPS